MHENRIEFTFTRSAAYDALFAEVRDYLNERFSPRQVESIFLHELIHWLRLMPYKINRDRKRAPMFFCRPVDGGQRHRPLVPGGVRSPFSAACAMPLPKGAAMDIEALLAARTDTERVERLLPNV